MNIGQNIKKIRELKGYKQEHIADKLGIDQGSYSRLESNGEKINFGQLNKIAQVLEVDPMDIISFDEKYVFNFNAKVSKNSGGVVNNHFPSTLKKLYEEQIKRTEVQYENRIKDLKEAHQQHNKVLEVSHEGKLKSLTEEIQFLRSQLDKK